MNDSGTKRRRRIWKKLKQKAKSQRLRITNRNMGLEHMLRDYKMRKRQPRMKLKTQQQGFPIKAH